MTCQDKIAPYLGEKFFAILLDANFVKLLESNLKIFGAPKELLQLSQVLCTQRGLEKVEREIKKTNVPV